MKRVEKRRLYFLVTFSYEGSSAARERNGNRLCLLTLLQINEFERDVQRNYELSE